MGGFSTVAGGKHASTHASGGSDPVSLDASQITSGVLSLDRLSKLLLFGGEI